jgi:hypothetical protein
MIERKVNSARRMLGIGTFILGLIFLLITEASAQVRKIQNIPRYDKQKMHFGFSLGFAMPDFRVVLAPDFKNMDSVKTVSSESQLGFLLGIISNLRIAEHFDLRFVPILTFAQRNLIYSAASSQNIYITPTTKKVESTFLEFPVFVKFKSTRINNYRFYVLGGAKYSMDLVSQAKVEESDKEPVRLKPVDYGYEIGCGFDFYLPYFKFAMEIKMYQGINNILAKDNLIYSRVLDKLNSQIFYISFLFE